MNGTGLIIRRVHAVITHLRGGHHHDLLGVRRIGEDLLVPSHRCVEHYLAYTGRNRTESFPLKRTTVF